MRYLAFESSCDETAAAVVEERDGRLYILSNIVASQIEVHRRYGGVVPEIASRAHIEAISAITEEALSGAGVTMADIGAVAVTSHPGLIGALLVGVNFAKSLAAAEGLPLVPVDHIRAHIAANFLKPEGKEAPKPPFLSLVVSGGHTALYRSYGYTDLSYLGGTRDDAMGEAFDKIGRLIGIPYPAGAEFDRLAGEGFRQATGKDDVRAAYRAFGKCPVRRDARYRLPSPALPNAGLDLSFSGLKTAAINLLHRAEQTGEPIDRALFAAAYTYEAVEAVARRTQEALPLLPGRPLLLAGGVAANSHLRARLSDICAAAGVPLHIPPLSLCGDNAAMVGAAGHYAYLDGVRAGDDLNASAADDV